MKRPKREIDRDILLAKVPQGAAKIQVLDEKGKLRYRTLDSLADRDTIQVNKEGNPIIMMARPGRPSNSDPVELEPINSTVRDILKKKNSEIEQDKILEVAKRNPESNDLLQYTIMALAEEAASIGFERKEAERQGQETSNISTRRINALKTMVDTWLKRKDQIATKEIDLKSPATRALFQYVFEMFRDAMETSGIVPEMSETIFAKVAKMLDSEQWENEARNRMKSAT